MARTGLTLASMLRFAIANLADKLGEPVTMPRAGDAHQKQPGSGHEPGKPTIEPRTTDSDPELDLDF